MALKNKSLVHAIPYHQIRQQWFSVCIFPLSPDSYRDYRLDRKSPAPDSYRGSPLSGASYVGGKCMNDETIR